jgi:hypothetical protein
MPAVMRSSYTDWMRPLPACIPGGQAYAQDSEAIQFREAACWLHVCALQAVHCTEASGEPGMTSLTGQQVPRP